MSPPRANLALRLDAVGLTGPGLPGWTESLPVLRGERPHRFEPLPRPALDRLPARERRRVTPTIALALAAASEVPPALLDPPPVAVFACSGGDTEVIDRICRALNLPDRPVSPANFHNSVHNAPAGYWSIALGAGVPMTSLSAFDASLAAGFLEAATGVVDDDGPRLLVAYDTPPPPPLWAHRPLAAPFAVAFLLGPDTTGLARLRLDLEDGGEETSMDDPSLERLRAGNPAARALPLLALLARGGTGTVRLPYLRGNALRVDLLPQSGAP